MAGEHRELRIPHERRCSAAQHPDRPAQHILAAIEHATRRIRALGTTAHPTAA
ncbi:hypothetical protein AB0E78_08185 [Streptomyces sp. NPDC032198]|uniref:hypothetical protein n=1 Tax=Streptomyces sp. NPDC032198 TaxID=3155127 RepID=UPI0034001F31